MSSSSSRLLTDVNDLAPAVVWHDLECGGYTADLSLWRELAAEVAGPVFDVGAGTGRVSLDLARAGHAVLAIDREPLFVAACARRAVGLPIRSVVADARTLDIEAEPTALCVVPMQTVQLLDGEGRSAFLRAARARTLRGGLLACALVDELQPFDETVSILPTPDAMTIGNVTYTSQPIAVRELADRVVLERRRTIDDGQEQTVEHDVTSLYRVTARELQRDARAVGWLPQRSRSIAATAEHVGSTVVMLRG